MTINDARRAWNNYKVYRANELRRAWRLSGMNFVAEAATKLACAALCIAAYLFLISDYANAKEEANNAAPYIAMLESVVAACLGDKDGRLTIGGEIHLCRAISIGEWVK